MKPVLISYPCHDMLHSDFAACVHYLLIHSMMSGLEVGFSQTRTSLVCASRNIMVQQALASTVPWGHMLCLDSDMTFPRNVLERLLSHNAPIVGASYSTRIGPHMMTHRDFDMSSRLPAMGDYPNDVYPVASMGMGCVLINLDVFRAMLVAEPDLPLFQVTYRSPVLHVSEDVHFFRRCQSMGIEVLCDIGLSHKVRHIGTKQYGIDDVERVLGDDRDLEADGYENPLSVRLPLNCETIEVNSNAR